MSAVALTEDSLALLGQLLLHMPAGLHRKFLESAERYGADAEQLRQLAMLLDTSKVDLQAVHRADVATTVVYPIRRRQRRRIAFGWYGGKYSHLDWLLPLLPAAHHYCEPFGGSAAVLLNRAPSPVETYNDLDGEVVGFFRMLRNDTDALIKAIAFTPFARAEFAASLRQQQSGISELERARRFFVRARQVRTGLAQTASIGRWANCKHTTRAGMSGVVSRWLGSVEGLPEIAERLLRVQIENRPALDVITLYDAPDTLFYCDPPYPHESRGDSKAYRYELSEADHAALAEALHRVKGKAAVSGYRCELMDDLYSDWRRADAPEKLCHSVKQPRREALWMNYSVERAGG